MMGAVPYWVPMHESAKRNPPLEAALASAFMGAGWLVDVRSDEPPTASYDDSCASTVVRLAEELYIESTNGWPIVACQRIKLAEGLHKSALRRFQAGMVQP